MERKDHRDTFGNTYHDKYDALHELVRVKVLAYIRIGRCQDKTVAEVLIKAGMFKEIRKRARDNKHGIH